MSTGNELITLKQVNDYYKDLRKRSAPVIFNSVTGNPAVFSDGADGLPIQSLKVHLLPRQEGTGDPSPENIRSFIPWNRLSVFGGGKNLVGCTIGETNSVNGIDYTVLPDGGVNCEGTANGSSYGTESKRLTLPGGMYTFSVTGATNAHVVVVKNNTYYREINGVGSTTFALTEETVIHFYIMFLSGSVANETVYVQLEVGQTATAYEPYKQITKTVISPICGKNLFDKTAEAYQTGKYINDLTVIGGSLSYTENENYNVFQISVTPNTDYTFGLIKAAQPCYALTDANGNVTFINQNQGGESGAYKTIKTGPNDAYLFLSVAVSGTYKCDDVLQIEKGTSHTEYESYIKIYGGALDVVSGVMTVEWATKQFDGSSDEIWYFVQVGTSSWYRAYVVISDAKQPNDVSALADSYKAVSFNDRSYSSKLCMFGNENESPIIFNVMTELTTIEAFKAYLAENPLTICYQLATPVEIQLTPAQLQSLLGNNTILLDANGNIEVEYRADTGLFLKQNTVKDVQIQGASILDGNVAKIPIAGIGRAGVMRVEGMGVSVNQSSGELYIAKATDAGVKAGTSKTMPIVPSNQHISAFYALAKLAGVDMAQSSNPVGQFTDEAKIAIQKMLGVYEAPWELIREDTFTNAEEADHIITVDGNGEAFELTDVIMWFETPTQNTYAKKGYYGQIHFFMNNNDNLIISPEPGSWEQVADSNPHGFVIIGDQKDGMVRFGSMAQTTYTNSGPFRYRYMTLATSAMERNSGIFLASEFSETSKVYFTKINIKSVTGTGHYKLYGKRKWN